MKKILCLVLSLTFVFIFCGCTGKNTDELKFSQEITIAKMSSSPKCKTSNSISDVDDVLNVLGLIKKSPVDSDDADDDWEFMITINIDDNKLTYVVGKVFIDADGRQYGVSNFDVIKKKLDEIYDGIDTAETDYR